MCKESLPRRVRVDWRKKGGIKPAGVILCARPSKYGNPHDWQKLGRAESIRRFSADLDAMSEVDRASFLDPLRMATGLACYCQLTESCHVDEILKRL